MRTQLRAQLEDLGLRPGGNVLVHASYKSLGIAHPEEIIGALLGALGLEGTLLMPALTFRQEPRHIHDARHTPSCVGYLTDYFRTRPDTLRSLHPTHSVCATGRRAEELLCDHRRDTTPCGPNSPFNRMIQEGGQILMIGCGLRPNTTMHAVEEYVRPPYLFGSERDYTITDLDGRVFQKTYVTHGFAGYEQRYDRAAALLEGDEIRKARVGGASCHLLDARSLHRRAVAKLQENLFAFVDERREG